MTTREQAIQDEAEKAIYTVVKENHVGAEYEDHHCAITGDYHSVHHLLVARTAKKLTEHIALTEAAERVRAATADVSGLTPGLLAVPADYYSEKAEAEKNTHEESRHGFCGDEEQRPASEPAEKPDPRRPVTWGEWDDAEIKSISHACTATLIVRSRVAEALADTAPRAEYERAVRQLAKGWAWAITSDATGERVARYSQLCKRYGVEPEGGAK